VNEDFVMHCLSFCSYQYINAKTISFRGKHAYIDDFSVIICEELPTVVSFRYDLGRSFVNCI
jgi:hypothetical protein